MEFLRNTAALNALFYGERVCIKCLVLRREGLHLMPCFTEGENCFVVCVHTHGYRNQALVIEVFPKQIPQSSAESMNLLDKLPYRQTITP